MKNCQNECRFCSIQNGGQLFEMIDRPITQNEQYYMLASVGAMLEGWSLIVPKAHEYSMKNHYESIEFYKYTNKMIELVKKAYCVDRVIVFEHGANKFGSATACGTNHCHLHIVPITQSLLGAIKEQYDFQSCEFMAVGDVVGDEEYLLYADVSDRLEQATCYVHRLSEPVSQFFRKIIADKLGCSEKYNYKEYPNLEIAISTFKALSEVVENEG